jgi:hypothetical protein
MFPEFCSLCCPLYVLDIVVLCVRVTVSTCAWVAVFIGDATTNEVEEGVRTAVDTVDLVVKEGGSEGQVSDVVVIGARVAIGAEGSDCGGHTVRCVVWQPASARYGAATRSWTGWAGFLLIL